MKRTHSALLASMLACLGIVGCDNYYSPEIKYSVRTDPLVLDKNLGDERIEPDRPGVLPLLSSNDLQDPFNPMYPKRNDLFKEGKLRDPMRISGRDRRDLYDMLTELFGTPARPHMQASSDVLATLKLQEEALERGSALYRLNCMHCHGVTGDGRGPTARWVNPHPRDYRQGIFKFMSVDQTGGPRPPRRDDLLRVLRHGVEATAMPAFGMALSTDQLDDLVSYVIHLSIRGKVEFDTIVAAFDYDPATNKLKAKSGEESPPLPDVMVSLLDRTAKSWVDSQGKDSAIQVGAYPYDDGDLAKFKNSVLRGFHLFKGEASDAPGQVVSKEDAKSANCISCHTSYGRQALYKFDEWGTLTRPRDLTEGVFRGGHRPVDIYYRIHSGITGSGMTSFGKVISKTDSIWDLVNFVRTLPYPSMRKSMGIYLD